MRRTDRATALIMVPALLLVVIALGAMAVDLSLAHGVHRGAHRVVSAAADDAAGMLDGALVQYNGDVRIDPDAARRVALAHLAAADLPTEVVGSPTVTVSQDRTAVTVSIRVRSPRLFSAAIPGSAAPETMRITARGRLQR